MATLNQALCSLLVFACIATTTASAADRPSAPTHKEVSDAIHLASGYLVHACDENGKFAYKVSLLSGDESPSYNILRHAGTMYALAMLYQTHKDPAIAHTLVQAAAYMRHNYIAPDGPTGNLVVWSRPAPDHAQAELGATGLGLVALAAVRRMQPATVPLSELQALGKFVVSLQRDDGSFYSRYQPGSAAVSDWQSLYFPGEAILGLLDLYEVDPSRAWLTAAAKGLSFLAKSRASLATVPADHWALIATARFLPLCTDKECQPLREELLQHARQVCDAMLREQIDAPGSALDGAFDPEGRTAPTATRLEGLSAALEFLPGGDEDLRARIRTASQRGVAFLLRTQIRSGPFVGGVPGALAADSKAASTVRIDYVQHAMSAWLRYQAMMETSR